MYLLNIWLKQQYPEKDYENAANDPDILEEKRKRLRGLLREIHMNKILDGISCAKKQTDI